MLRLHGRVAIFIRAIWFRVCDNKLTAGATGGNNQLGNKTMTNVDYAILNKNTGILAAAFISLATAQNYLDFYLDKEQHVILPHGFIKSTALEAWRRSV